MSGKFKTRLFTADTISYFQGLLPKETKEVIYQGHDINKILNIFEARFPVIYHDKEITWVTRNIRISFQRKRRLYLLSRNCNDLELKIYYKHYCTVLCRVIRGAKNYITMN